jgi:hypothetical protein
MSTTQEREAGVSRVNCRVTPGAAAVVIASAFLFVSPARSGIIVSIEPPTQIVTYGSSVVIDVAIAGLGRGKAPSLGAFDLTLSFDPTLLLFQGLRFGAGGASSQLGPVVGSISGFTVDSAAGSVDLFEVSLEAPATLDSLQPDAFVLSELSFMTLRPGSGCMGLSDIILGDAQGAALRVDSIQGAFLTVQPITTVPENGASLGLLSIAIAAYLITRNFHHNGYSKKG